nr:phage virion morphogenesis protein [Maridesulfovibrio bastinii]
MSKFMRGIDTAIHQSQRTQELMDAVGDTLRTSVVQRFKTGIGPDGKKWKPSQRAIKQSGQTLVKNKVLMESIDYEATPQMVCVGSNEVYARIHQLGGEAGRGHKVKLPARPYLGIDDEDRAEIKALMVEHLKSMFGV